MTNTMFGLAAGALVALLGTGGSIARACETTPCDKRQEPARFCELGVDCAVGDQQRRPARVTLVRACDEPNCERPPIPSCPPDTECIPNGPWLPSAEACDRIDCARRLNPGHPTRDCGFVPCAPRRPWMPPDKILHCRGRLLSWGRRLRDG
ncbi:MAG: hypothetical protein QM820_05995 [Minicystis sp.]